MKKSSAEPEKKTNKVKGDGVKKTKKKPSENSQLLAVARIRKKREKIFADSPEKPVFQERKKLFRSRGFRRQFRAFRKSGLGLFDALFNAFYIVLTERSLEKQKEKLEKEGRTVTDEASLEYHGFLLQSISFLPRFFGWVVGFFHSLGKKERGKDGEPRSVNHLRKYAVYYNVLFIFLLVTGFVVFQLSRPVVLRAEIDGQLIGTVENKHLVDSAVNELEDNVEIILGTSFHFPHEIRYSFKRSFRKSLTEKSVITERLYSYLTDYICTAGGLYVDDVLVAVCEDEESVRRGLEDFVNANSGGEEMGIFNEIRVTTQAYPADSILDYAEFQQLLKEMSVPLEERKKENVVESEVLTEVLKPATSSERKETEVPAMALVADFSFVPEEKTVSRSNRPQPIDDIQLELYTAKVENYDTVLPYETRYVESNEHYTTMADVTTRGANGKAKIEAKVYYVDGKEVRREILSEKISKEPVDRVISIGTKLLPEAISPVTGKNSFIVPRVGYVSHYYGPRGDRMHSGWDIPGDEGDNIYAAASGTVVVAIGPKGFFAENSAHHYSGYGYCIVIRHENGFSTMYAHCNDIYVTLGQEVKQGEIIGAVGNTGRSDGDHVHFEVILNGQRVDPAPYMYKGTKTIYD